MSTLELLAYTAPVIAVLGFLLSPWGMPVFAFLTGTRAGRYLATVAAFAYAAFVVWSATYRSGKRAGSAGVLREVESANVKAVERHEAIKTRIEVTGIDAIREELRRYSPVVLLALTFGLGGCATVPTGGPGKGGAWCDIERPIALTGTTIDVMTSDELRAAVTHNRHGEAECGWKPPGRKS